MADDPSKISLGLEFSPEIFPIEIVFHPSDQILNTPVIYMPYIPVKDDKVLPEWMMTEAYNQYDAMKNQKTERGDVTYEDNDSEESFVERITPELKCIRRGRILVRVYGPPDGEKCNVSTKVQMKVMQNIYDQRNWSSARLNLFYRQGARLMRKIISFQGNTGDYKLDDAVEPPTEDDSEIKTAAEYFIDELSKGDDICQSLADKYKTTEMDDQGSFTNPCKKVSRKTHEKFREVLTFSGDISKRIKYWYVEPSKISILKKSVFLNKNGGTLSNGDKPSNNRDGKIGVEFIAKTPCYGSILVEYDVDYTLFIILYDLEKPKRKLRVHAGTVEKVGFLTAMSNGGIAEQGDKLFGNDIDIDWTIDEYDERLKKDVTHNLALTRKIEWLPYTPEPIPFFVTDKVNIVTSTFTPDVEFNDFILNELPKMAIYERRMREGYIDHIEEVVYVDVMGNVTTENLEQRDNV